VLGGGGGVSTFWRTRVDVWMKRLPNRSLRLELSYFTLEISTCLPLVKPNAVVNILVYVLSVLLVYRIYLSPYCTLFRGVWLKLLAVFVPTQDIRAIDTSKATGPVSRVYYVAVRDLTDHNTVAFCDSVFSFRKNYSLNPPLIYQL
jgi:hypothetical protein